MSNPTSLKSLAENKAVPEVTKEVSFRIAPSKIEFEEGFNLREDNDETKLHVERLYKAMKSGAFIPPIDVSLVDGKVVARDGHCRTRAALKLAKEMPEYTLQCRQLVGNDADAILHMLGTGSGSKPLTPLEQGRGYLRLINMGMKVTEIAARSGFSRVTIDNGLTLAQADTEIQKMISNGEVSSTTVRDAIKAGADAVKALKEAVTAEREKPAQTGEPNQEGDKKGGGAAKKKAAKKAAKKKVTAKTLKGTAADNKQKKEDKKKKLEAEQDKILNGPSVAAQQAETTSNGSHAIGTLGANKNASEVTETQPYGVLKSDDPNTVTIVIKKGTAKITAEFLRGFGGDDPDYKAVASAFEMALM